MSRLMVGLIGAAEPSAAGLELAREIGERIARAGAVLVCGGLGGVMQAAAQGSAEAGGDVLGLLPGPDASAANPYITLPVATNMGHARNVIIAHTAAILLAVEGGYGTLSEAAIALKLGKRVLSVGGSLPLAGVETVATAEEAVAIVLQTFAVSGEEGTCRPI